MKISMIRSVRTSIVRDLKSSRKRRWISSIPTCIPPAMASPLFTSLVHSFSFRSAEKPSSICHGGRAKSFVTGNNYSITRRGSILHFYSTKNESTKSKEETENDRNNEIQRTVWDQIKSLPNIITLSRLASTPILCYWIINDEPNLAIAGCFLAGVSDVLDGYIAKNHGGSTVLGTYLDPFADKFFINSLAISLWYSGVLPTPLTVLWASKDFMLLGGMGWYLYREQRTINFFSNSTHMKPLTVTPSTLGKVNTGLQFATLAVGILTPVVSVEILQPVVLQSLCWVTGATSVTTTLSYAGGGNGFKYSDKDEPTTKESTNSEPGKNDVNTKV